MKIEKKHLYATIFILYLLLVGVSMSYWNDMHMPRPLPEPVKVSVHDTIYINRPTLVETKIVEVPQYVDTSTIIEKYYSCNVYVDTVRSEQMVDICVVDSVYQNQLISQRFEILSVPQVVVSGAAPSRSAALGVVTGRNLLTIKADFRLRRNIFTAGYDIVNRSPVVGYSYQFISW